MTTFKGIITTILATILITSCDNPPSNISADNYYQLRKQLFKYQGAVDQTADIKKNAVDFPNDSLELILRDEAEKVVIYIDSIKQHLMTYFKVADPSLLTKKEIVNYSFQDSLFSYASLNSIFCGEGGHPPDTHFTPFKLRAVLNKYYQTIRQHVNGKTYHYIFYPKDYTDRHGVIIQWEFQHFFKNNLITTLTNLEKVKQEVYLTFVDIKNNRRHYP